MPVVYQHINVTTKEVFYVGIGKTEKRAYSKHGRAKFWRDYTTKYKYEVIISHRNLIWEEACVIEKYLIAFWGRRDLGLGPLVNMTDGGDGVFNLSEDIKTKIKQSLKGRKSWSKGLTKETDSRVAKYARKLTGRVRTEQHCANLSEAKRGKPNFKVRGDNSPVKRPEVREKIRQAKIGKPGKKGNKHTSITKQKISEKRKQYYTTHPGTNSKQVHQLDKLTETIIATYRNATEAQKATGIDRFNIRGCCNGKYKSAGGYKWINVDNG